MNPAQSSALRALLEQQDVAALGTLQDGEPFVSMVPYAVLPGGEGLVIHVSRLAAHTRNMLGHAGVSLMVMAPRPPDTPPEGLARVTIQGQARPLSSSDPAYATARQAYLSRLPSTEALFGFGDFSLFVIVPATLRLVGGFGQAHSLPGEALRVVMAGADAPGAV